MKLTQPWYLVLTLLPCAILFHAILANASTITINKHLHGLSGTTLTAMTIHHPSLCNLKTLVWQLWKSIARLWIVVECLFYMHYIATHKRLQAINKPILLGTKEQREQIYMKCFDTVDNVEKWSVGWFYHRRDKSHPSFNEIYRRNIALWFAWAYWDKHLDEVLGDDEWANQLEWMIDTVEDKYKVRFPAGYNDNIKCIRLSLDPVLSLHRPLLFYLITYISVIFFDTLVMRWWWQFRLYGDYSTVWGGILHKIHQGYIWIYTRLTDPPQCSPLSKSSSKSPTCDKQHRIVYWYRPATSTTCRQKQQGSNNNSRNLINGGNNMTPVVFLHGIGAGPSFYSILINNLVDMNRPLFVVELPFAATHMVETAPEAEDIAIGIKSMLQDHQFKQAVFVSHSFGTLVTAWVKNLIPTIVAGIIMVDPVCFLLNHAHVCFNFVHRKPTRFMQALIFYFASREMYIIHYFTRIFRWQPGSYFAEATKTTQVHRSLPNTTIFLSENDCITDSFLVADYFDKIGMDYRFMPKMEHGEFLIKWTWRKRILDQIDRVARNVDDEGVEL
ncbi:hypothetical protein BC941DRAFT_236369 [Chlamydoabsidia padenii]|nr:hypothetical protein BC941DRAFT_236369 [Chlamydoabsidia padenii]